MVETLFTGGLVYMDGALRPLDVLMAGETIARIAPRIDAPDAARFDLNGRVLSPGFIDLHVHLREPGYEYKETIATGTRAAAAGGFTTVCAMPNLRPVPDCQEALAVQQAAIAKDALVEVLPYGAITRGQGGQELSDMEALAPFCPGFSDDGRGVQDASLMKEAMRRARALHRPIVAHAEDEALLAQGLSAEAEWRQVARDLELVRETGAQYHICHVSAKETVALLRRAKAEGLPVSAECTPHQLAFSMEGIPDEGRFKMNPPLRTRDDREAIIEGLIDGTIDAIATDHAPHSAAEKAGGFAASVNGVVGLETAFAACHTALVRGGHCDLPRLLDRLTHAPARVLGRQVGIAPGSIANLTVIDPEAVWTVDPDKFYSLGRSSPFAGERLTGRVDATFYKGVQL
ncbi:MAG: dihydroorotase [Oscillospiraceae bacterium]|jgi:dihydroorotase|nr:dihydroorotase [Oscillospiraceae bacterium]